jgi:hypothetical protein
LRKLYKEGNDSDVFFGGGTQIPLKMEEDKKTSREIAKRIEESNKLPTIRAPEKEKLL